MAKITKATRGGRTIYKIAGTSKYAFTLTKAKEIAAKMGGAKRTTAGKRAAKKPLTARDVSRLGAKQVVALAVPRPTRARLMDFYRDIKEMGAEALAERGISPATEAFALKVRSALEDAMDEAEGVTRKKSAAYTSASGKPAKRSTRKPASRRKATTTKRTTTKRRTTRRNPMKAPRAGLAKTMASRMAKLDERNARLIQSDATYDVHSSLFTKGRTPRRGRSVGEAEGKREAIRIAEAYIEEQGLKGLLYREDVGNAVIYRGKSDSGIAGMLELYPVNDDEVLAQYAGIRHSGR